jgi:hypothetical protein
MSSYTNIGSKWTERDKAYLVELVSEKDDGKAMPLTKIATCLWRDVRGILYQVYKTDKTLLHRYSNEIAKLRDSHHITEKEAKMFLVDSVSKESDAVPIISQPPPTQKDESTTTPSWWDSATVSETIAQQPPTQDHAPADKYMQILVEIRDLLKAISQTHST